MDDVRLALAVVAGVSASLVALAVCGRDVARAGPDRASGLAAPAGWKALPTVAKTARDALGSTVTVEGAEAWGEPARGCYAVWLAMAASGPAEKIAVHVLDGLASPAAKAITSSVAGSNAATSGGASKPSAAGFAVRDVEKPAGPDGVLRLSIERGTFRGKLAARLGSGRIVALACFANQREPASCEPGCRALLGAIR